MKNQKYVVRVLPGHTAKKDQIINGCLAAFGQIQQYSQKEAARKAQIFGGMAEAIRPKTIAVTFTRNQAYNLEGLLSDTLTEARQHCFGYEDRLHIAKISRLLNRVAEATR